MLPLISCCCSCLWTRCSPVHSTCNALLFAAIALGTLLLSCRLLKTTAASSSRTNAESSSTHQQQSSLARQQSSLSHSEASDIRAATLLAWPGSSAAARAKRAAALHLLKCPSMVDTSSQIASAVKHELGATTQQSGLGPFRQLLQQDDCFTVQDTQESEARVQLRRDRYAAVAVYQTLPSIKLWCCIVHLLCSFVLEYEALSALHTAR